MIKTTRRSDSALRRRFDAITKSNEDFWSFKGNSRREHGHGLFPYPAMMVPQLVQTILEQACAIHPEIECVGDPFLGSGTILTESMMHGRSFIGTDINPLAILLCKVKAGPFFPELLLEKMELLLSRIDADVSERVEVGFPNLDKWFEKEIQVSLSKIVRSIRKERVPWVRRFFWVAIAETVRLSSNSRTSTFKLHIRKKEDIDNRKRSLTPINFFRSILKRNFSHYSEQATQLRNKGLLDSGSYSHEMAIEHKDIRDYEPKNLCDIIITSPPYGDNQTTVPYGQYSYLPLQWIDLWDIDDNISANYIDSIYTIDRLSLGGKRDLQQTDFEHLSDRSVSYRKYIDSIKDSPNDRKRRVTAFFRDLDNSLNPILKMLNSGGLMVWTIGNRRVGGKQVPLDSILEELLGFHRTKLLCRLTRQISSKRMALKNSVSETMANESILVMRKQ